MFARSIIRELQKVAYKEVNSLRMFSEGKLPTLRFAAIGECKACCSDAEVWTAVNQVKWRNGKYVYEKVQCDF